MTNAQHGPRVAARSRSTDERRSRSTSSRSRRTQREVARSASTPRTCSSSGTGSAAATRCGPRSACSIGARDRLGRLSRAARRRPRDGRALPHRAARAATCPCVLGLLGVWYANFFGARRTRSCRTTSTCSASRLPPAGRHGVERQARRLARRSRRLRDRPDHLGRARHERPARLLPAHPPGHARRSRATSSRRSRRTTRSAATTTCWSRTSSRRPRRSRSAATPRRASRTASSTATGRPTPSCSSS